MTRMYVAIAIVFILVGCDSGLKSENINLRSENVKLSQQVAKSQARIDKLQFQMDKLNNEAQNFSVEIAKSRAKQYNPQKNKTRLGGDEEGTVALEVLRIVD